MSEGNTLNDVLVVIDPTEREQYALTRALMMNDFIKGGVKVHLFISLEQEKLQSLNSAGEFYAKSDWFEQVAKPLKEANIEFTSEVYWTENWHDSVVDASKRYNIDLIILSDYRKEDRATELSATKWSLLRDSICPVLIVDPTTKLHKRTILSAVNMQTDNPKYAKLNDKIIQISNVIAESYGAQKHFVNACEGIDEFPDRQRMMRIGDTGRKNIHIKIGDPTDVIGEVSKAIDTDMVIIGTLARKGVMAAMVGNKSEDIIKRLNRDVLVVNSAD